ncbi:FUSC family protein [Rhodoplanes sp. Z2-YC6860]|uniref:FUSC family protein n=1 Tax=Rhodoplanes sp. Z2-YC6860 TaxID=674703 RepID=UPI00078D8D8B|nr:FUSC family protein [Rhodoplanes sp. Z2-YC6860]AMN44351.1 fusaric acid resistance domain protein [Rhodoplanes sp. Z2-YC6860]
MNRSLPQASQAASFRLRQLIELRPGPWRWWLAVHTSICLAAPVAIGWAAGDVPAGLIAAIGAFTALYGADRPYRNRALVLATTALGFACAVALGVWSQTFGPAAIVTVVLVAMGATFLCNAFRMGPPGAYMFALAGAVGTGLPIQHLTWWHAGLLVLAGGGLSLLVRLAGTLRDPRGPERNAVAAASAAVARFLQAVGSSAEDTARHAAALALHDTWNTLVSRQPARPSNDSVLHRLRSISRELHRLFIDGISAGPGFPDRDTRVKQARELGTEARLKQSPSAREAPEHLPLGRLSLAESLRESLIWPSPVLVVTLRVGLAAAVSGLVGAAFNIERAYWMVAAAVLILHQGWDWSRSLQRTVERVIGTLLGLVLAGVVLWLEPQGLWLALTLGALQFVIELLVIRNYTLAVLFITAIALTMSSGGHEAPSILVMLWDRGVDTVIGCAIGIGVLLVTAPRAVAVQIPQELAAALKAAQEVLNFVATGDAVSTEAKRARRNLQHRAIVLLTAYELGAGARAQDRRYAEELWPAVISAQRLLYRVLAFCWMLEDAGPDRAIKIARKEFGADGFTNVSNALDILANAATDGRPATIASEMPEFLKEELDDLSRSLAR